MDQLIKLFLHQNRLALLVNPCWWDSNPPLQSTISNKNWTLKVHLLLVEVHAFRRRRPDFLFLLLHTWKQSAPVHIESHGLKMPAEPYHLQKAKKRTWRFLTSPSPQHLTSCLWRQEAESVSRGSNEGICPGLGTNAVLKFIHICFFSCKYPLESSWASSTPTRCIKLRGCEPLAQNIWTGQFLLVHIQR